VKKKEVFYWEHTFDEASTSSADDISVVVSPFIKGNKPSCDGIEFDSNEEVEFYQWCKEAKEIGVILDFFYHPEPFVLCESRKYLPTPAGFKAKEKHLFREHIYTPDFVLFTTNTLTLKPAYQDFGKVFIDIKGGFSKFGGGREFSINQKWVHEQFGVYVHKVVPEKFFADNGVPEAVRMTPKTGKIREKYKAMKRLTEITTGENNAG